MSQAYTQRPPRDESGGLPPTTRALASASPSDRHRASHWLRVFFMPAALAAIHAKGTSLEADFRVAARGSDPSRCPSPSLAKLLVALIARAPLEENCTSAQGLKFDARLGPTAIAPT